MSFPHYTTSKAGDFISTSEEVAITATNRVKVRFREREDYTGPTSGYHFKQLLLNGKVIWEEDVAGGTNGWRDVAIEFSAAAAGKAELAFRLFDKHGVGNFGVRTLQLTARRRYAAGDLVKREIRGVLLFDDRATLGRLANLCFIHRICLFVKNKGDTSAAGGRYRPTIAAGRR